jgi:diguanylate cyclase (GGDEF)-like protein
MNIHASAEDYLETILLLSKKTGAVRSIDIVNDMGFSKPSVSVAMKKLRESEMILMDNDGFISLTPKGESAAEKVYQRHSTLYDWLAGIGVEEKQAAADACRMEHVLSEDTFAAIKALNDKAGHAEQLEMLKSILNGLEGFIVVSVPEDGKLLFINDSTRRHFGIEGDVEGLPCYEVLQNRDTPCVNCPYKKIMERPGESVSWQHTDSVKGSIMRLTARLIDWPGGKKGHMEYGIDITEHVKTRKALEHREHMLDILNRAAIVLLSQGMDSLVPPMTEGVSIISSIADIDRVSIFRNTERPDGLYVYQAYRWSRKTGANIDLLGEYRAVPYSGDYPNWKDTLAAGKHINGPVREMPGAAALMGVGCVSLLAVPIIHKSAFWGFVLFENLSEERMFTEPEVEILRSASFMLANTVILQDEAQKMRDTDTRLKRVVGEVERQNQLLFTANRVLAILLQAEADTFEGDLMRALGIMAQAARADRAYIFENYTENGKRYCSLTYEWCEGAEPQLGKEYMKDISYSEVVPNWEKAFLNRQCINSPVRDLSETERNLLKLQDVMSVLTVPIFVKDKLWGFVGFDDCHAERFFTANEENVLRSSSGLIANVLIRNSMERNILHLEVEADKIFYDPLTELYNRRFLDETLRRLLRTLSRAEGMISLMMIDIDFFKNYNDTYGHVEGDNSLKKVAAALRESVTRADDFVARYGGEEFLVVLPNTDEDGARMVARRVMENIRKCAIPHESSTVDALLTVSIGVATGKADHAREAGHYVRRADELLYESKRGGRNRYTFGEF